MSGILTLLQEGRVNELSQALFYRFLSGDAELAGDRAAAERLNELLADEQHHVSRLTARILELGGKPGEGAGAAEAGPGLDAWEPEARRREAAEVRWYERALEIVDDPATRLLLEEILDSERHHMESLAGKWMPAAPATPTEGT